MYTSLLGKVGSQVQDNKICKWLRNLLQEHQGYQDKMRKTNSTQSTKIWSSNQLNFAENTLVPILFCKFFSKK